MGNVSDPNIIARTYSFLRGSSSRIIQVEVYMLQNVHSKTIQIAEKKHLFPPLPFRSTAASIWRRSRRLRGRPDPYPDPVGWDGCWDAQVAMALFCDRKTLVIPPWPRLMFINQSSILCLAWKHRFTWEIWGWTWKMVDIVAISGIFERRCFPKKHEDAGNLLPYIVIPLCPIVCLNLFKDLSHRIHVTGIVALPTNLSYLGVS